MTTPPSDGPDRTSPWIVRGSQLRYKNAWLEVREDDVIRPDGQPGAFATVRMKPGVSVLAADEDGFVYLTAEFRYAVGRESVEAVSGGLDGEEAPLEAAKRELREELGIEALEWVDLGSVDPFTSLVHSPARLYLARGLRFARAAPEATEIIRVVRVSLADAVRMVMTSEISHGPSCVLILKADAHLNRRVGGEEASLA